MTRVVMRTHDISEGAKKPHNSTKVAQYYLALHICFFWAHVATVLLTLKSSKAKFGDRWFLKHCALLTDWQFILLMADQCIRMKQDIAYLYQSRQAESGSRAALLFLLNSRNGIPHLNTVSMGYAGGLCIPYYLSPTADGRHYFYNHGFPFLLKFLETLLLGQAVIKCKAKEVRKQTFITTIFGLIYLASTILFEKIGISPYPKLVNWKNTPLKTTCALLTILLIINIFNLSNASAINYISSLSLYRNKLVSFWNPKPQEQSSDVQHVMSSLPDMSARL